MISVLIPVYNYNIVYLIKEVHKQLIACNIPFEILCLEDGSEQKFITQNEEISSLSFTNHILSEINEGRLIARKKLSKEATYNYLLYLDADVMPKNNQFIKNYLNELSSNNDAYFGGFTYYETPPKQDYLLRWKYGKNCEQVLAKDRNKNPYKVIISANFIIKKSVYLNLNLSVNKKLYGYDNYFGSQLKKHNISVKHIDNEVYHLGIETSKQYLKKKEQAAEALYYFYKQHLMTSHENSLLKLFITLKKLYLHHFFSFIYISFKNKMQHQLTGKNPSLLILQLYRISYLCYWSITNV